jgi:DNA-binding SARP family transcriptional activator
LRISGTSYSSRVTEVGLRLLGPVELHVDGVDVRLGPARQRTVLAALAVDAGRPVLLDTIVDRVWGDDPPDQVRAVVYSYVARLRQALRPAGGQAAVARRHGGYALDCDPAGVDLILFDHLARRGEYDAALALWRGPALAGLAGDWVASVRGQAAQRRLDAVVGWARARLAAGGAAEVIDRLRPLVEENPLVEPLAAVYIEALHRDSRAAEALDRWAATRRRLIDELGTEPGPALRELHQVMLHAEPAAPSTLPADTGAFVGRRAEVARLVRAGPGVHAIAGMPGVGKTALAVHVAHRLRDAYPDGQHFVNLHGHTAGRPPADPADVLATLLAADGLDPRRLPSGVDARAALWRSRLAARRTMLVLDNAASSDQVIPLIPAAAGCLVLVTSRRFLGDLPADAVPATLDVLAAEEAAEMFRRLAPAAANSSSASEPTGDRVRASTSAGDRVRASTSAGDRVRASTSAGDAAALVAASGRLPLAVALLARLLRRHPGWTVADLLRETRERLLDATAEHASIAAAFDLSYRHLPAGRQRFFGLLASHPGTELEPVAAGALAGVRPATARAELDALHGDGLLIEIGRNRYTMHDLIRAYATNVTTSDRAATARLLDFYAATAAAASARISRLTRPGSFSAVSTAHDVADPLGWLRRERSNLIACLDATDEPERIVALTAGIGELLRRDGPWSEALHRHEAAVRHARGPERSNALIDLATIRRLGGDYPGAVRDARRALDHYRSAGNRLGEANALTMLAKALSRSGGYEESKPLAAEALAAYRELGDRPGEAGALVELGIARGMTSDFRAALELLGEALDRYRALGDRPGEAYAMRILGIAHGRVGDFAGARRLLGGALRRYRELGTRLGEALTHNDLGRAAAGMGDFAADRPARTPSPGSSDRAVHRADVPRFGAAPHR